MAKIRQTIWLNRDINVWIIENWIRTPSMHTLLYLKAQLHVSAATCSHHLAILKPTEGKIHRIMCLVGTKKYTCMWPVWSKLYKNSTKLWNSSNKVNMRSCQIPSSKIKINKSVTKRGHWFETHKSRVTWTVSVKLYAQETVTTQECLNDSKTVIIQPNNNYLLKFNYAMQW